MTTPDAPDTPAPDLVDPAETSYPAPAPRARRPRPSRAGGSTPRRGATPPELQADAARRALDCLKAVRKALDKVTSGDPAWAAEIAGLDHYLDNREASLLADRRKALTDALEQLD